MFILWNNWYSYKDDMYIKIGVYIHTYITKIVIYIYDYKINKCLNISKPYPRSSKC
jgi:hypothetical protein